MKISKAISNILTIGGNYRLEKNKREYEKLYEQYKNYYNEMKPLMDDIVLFDNKIKDYVTKIKNIFSEFSLDTLLSDDLKKDILERPESYVMNKSLKLSTKEISAIIGSSVALPITAYQLIVTFGSASTGTAISSIPLVSQSGVVLSWLGGGSVATGGFGIALGQFILPGLMVLPLSYIAIKKHKTASVYKDKIKEINLILNKRLSNEQINEELLKIKEKRTSFEQMTKDFEKSLADLCEGFSVKTLEIIKG